MSNSTVVARLRDAIVTVIRTPLWASIVIAEGVLALVATALTVLSTNTTAEGLDAGRMALSFTTLLVLAFGLFTVPAIVERVRRDNDTDGFVNAFLITAIVSASLLIAAVPALLWAILATGVDVSVWMAALSALKFEFAVVILIVSLSLWSIRRRGVATAISYAAITSLMVGPLVALGVVAALPGVTQTTRTWSMQWPDDQSEIDPATGYPKDPTCPNPVTSTVVVPRYDAVWWAVPVNPFVLVAESVEPRLAEFVYPGYADETGVVAPDVPRTLAPVDLFSTIALSSRALQRDQGWEISINECELLDETGEPYAPYPYGPDATEILATTQSGVNVGLIGQSAMVAVWAVGIVVIPRIRRRQ